MAELTARDRALVLAHLGATSRWLSLIAGWLAEAGTEPEAAGLVDAAVHDIVAICRRLAAAEN